MKTRISLAALGLAAFACLHGYGAFSLGHAGFPAGMTFTEVLDAVGCSVAAYGLLRRRFWARCFGLGIGVVALSQIVGLAIWSFVAPATYLRPDLLTGLGGWAAQTLLFVGLVAALSGAKMRKAFEEGPASPWTFGDPPSALARLTRASVVAGVGAIAMLCWSSATAAYAANTDARYATVVAAGVMLTSLVLLLRGKTAGLPLLALSSIAGGVSAMEIVSSLDTDSLLPGVDWYTAMPVVGAAATLPGVALGIGVLGAFLPGMVRFLAAPDAAAVVASGKYRIAPSAGAARIAAGATGATGDDSSEDATEIDDAESSWDNHAAR